MKKKQIKEANEKIASEAKILSDLRRYTQTEYYNLRENGASHSLALAIITENLYKMVKMMHAS